MKEEMEVYHGSGNVFADLELPDSEERLSKAELARQILNVITERRLTQSQTAELLGIDQPKGKGDRLVYSAVPFSVP